MAKTRVELAALELLAPRANQLRHPALLIVACIPFKPNKTNNLIPMQLSTAFVSAFRKYEARYKGSPLSESPS